MKLLPIFKDHVPYEAQYRLGNATYKLIFNYNYYGDYFTVDLHRGADILRTGEKVVFGKPLFSSFLADPRFPTVVIVPADLSLNTKRAGWDEMSDSVYMYLPGVIE